MMSSRALRGICMLLLLSAPLLSLDAHDKAAANFGLARALYALGDTGQGRRHLLDALETAPHYRPAQDFLLQKIGERDP